MSTRKPVVVVTGASRGIGFEVTKSLLTTYRSNVVAISRTRSLDLNELQLLHPGALLILRCDITNENALKTALSQAEDIYGHLDGLILNAGIVEPLCRLADDTPLASWRQHFDVNFFSLVTAINATLPALRKSELGGRVVFISSGAAIKGVAGWGPYSASKAAMNSLSRTLATEEPNVISVALRPGMVDTAMQQHLRDNGGTHMEADNYQFFVDTYTSGKLNKPADVGSTIAALSLRAPKSLSGEFIDWNSEQCKALLA